MPSEEELSASVDALLAGTPKLPPPGERARLRRAAGASQLDVARALQVSVKTVKNWECGRNEPRPPQSHAYRRLLQGWAQAHPV
jgi:DNA-binding transcriptional regulator YiaG